MSDLDRRISGDWIELREKANDLHSLLDWLSVPPAQMLSASTVLRHSVEQGIVEFKRAQFAPVLVSLEAARYKSLAAEDMTAQEGTLSVILLVTLFERLLCTESVPLARPREQKRDFGVEGLQVNAVLADLNARVKADPALRTHPAVKNILMLVQRYNNENQKMRELVVTIKPEMRTSFLGNFTRTFEEIIGSIRRQYSTLLEEAAAAENTRKEGFSLALLPLKELAPLLATQAKEMARFRSTLAHAREEKYKTRESLVRLYDSRPTMLKLIEDEAKLYRRMCQRIQGDSIDACATAMAFGLRDEVATLLEKQGRREPAGP